MSNMKARCTKQIEKERDGDAIGVWKTLYERSRTRYRQAFERLAQFANSTTFADLKVIKGTTFGRSQMTGPA
jgi:hypothetical protein